MRLFCELTKGIAFRFSNLFLFLMAFTLMNLFHAQNVYSSEDFNSNTALASFITEPSFIEIGEVIINAEWERVEFTKSFTDPVVVAKPLSYNDDDPAVVRVTNVDETGFYIRIQEWDYQDGIHGEETVSYIVMERGSYTLLDGTMVEAGRLDTDKMISNEPVSFNQTFNVVPVVITAVTSINEEDAVTTRIRNISTDSFELRMQEQEEANSQSHTTETISYIAWEPSSGTIGDLTFEVTKTKDVMRHKFKHISFNETFVNAPVFLADMQTTDNRNTANLRCENKDYFGVDVKIAEEQSRDREIRHATEVVGYMVFSVMNSTIDDGTVDYWRPNEIAGTITGEALYEKVRAAEYKKIPILMVHGLWGNSNAWIPLKQYLTQNGYSANLLYAIDITTDNSVLCSKNHVTQISNKIEQIVSEICS